MYFGFISLVNAALAVRALQTRRAATFFLLVNQFLVCRELARIAEHGQPASQMFLPTFLFGQSGLSSAQNLYLISTFILLVFSLLRPRNRLVLARPMPALPRLIIAAAGVYVCLLAASQQTILARAYSDVERYRLQVDLVGGGVLIFSLILYETVRRVQVGSMAAWKGFALIFALFLFTSFLKGETGLATGFVLSAAILMLGKKRNGRSAWLRLLAIGCALAAMVAVIRGVRANLHDQGLASIVHLLENGIENEDALDTTTTTGLVEGNLNGTQSATHVLMCVALWESGISREWRSISDAISYTFKPRFLVDRLGWTRSIDAPWELGGHFFHWGGINVLGELYWNGGYLCVLIMWTLLCLLAYGCDTRWERSFFWLMLTCQFAPAVLKGAGYGFNGTARGAINGLLVLGTYWVWKRLAARSRPGVPSPSPFSPVVSRHS